MSRSVTVAQSSRPSAMPSWPPSSNRRMPSARHWRCCGTWKRSIDTCQAGSDPQDRHSQRGGHCRDAERKPRFLRSDREHCSAGPEPFRGKGNLSDERGSHGTRGRGHLGPYTIERETAQLKGVHQPTPVFRVTAVSP